VWNRVATRTRSLFQEGIRDLGSPLSPEFYEALEELLIAGDAGPTLAARLSAAVRARKPRSLEEADVFAVHQAGGYTCVEVFFFRTGQNWGNRAYFPKADRALGPNEILSAFLAQFYDDKPPPKLVLLSHDIEECELLANALSIRSC
jgi:hypothetical protein